MDFSETTIYNGTRFHEGTGSLVVEDLMCSGTESDIDECASYPWTSTAKTYNCRYHYDDAEINCSKLVYFYKYLYNYNIYIYIQLSS